MTKPDHPEVGRELLVKDLKPRTVICLQKEGCPHTATLWVIEILPDWVHFRATAVEFFAKRYGPEKQLLRDDSGLPLQAYEYLGEI
jgi:hypothetical protein